MPHTMNEIQQSKEQNFQSQQEIMTHIYTENGLQHYFDSLSAEQLQALLSSEHIEGQLERCSCCIDEGINLGSNQLPAARFAGSAILLGEERAKQLWLENSVTKVTAHVSCGAAMLNAKGLGHDTASQEEADEIAKNTLQQWAIDVGLEFEYISQLSRPAYHDARGVAIDATRRLKLHHLENAPRMFQVTAHADASEVANDAKLAFAIAGGDHGFQELITNEQPFVIGLVGTNEDQYRFNAIINQLNSDGWLESQNGRVVVQSAYLKSEVDDNQIENTSLAAD